MQKRKAPQLDPTFKARVIARAYQLSQEDPSRSPQENWRLAEGQLLEPCQPTLRCFLLVVLLAFLVFLVFGLIYQTMMRLGLTSWPLQLFYYVLVAVVALLLVHLIAESKALQQGCLWPFIGLVKAFRHEGKTFWDFLDLIGGAALLGLIASMLSFFVTQSNQKWQANLQRDREHQQLLIDYVKDITGLLDGENRNYERLNDDLRISISTRTLNTIQALAGDSLRQGDAIRFASRVTPRTICESGRVDTLERCSFPDNIPVVGVKLRNFVIDSKGDIPREFFQGLNLSWSNFQGSNFETAVLASTNLRGADLSRTRFAKDVQLHNADFSLADLTSASFDGVSLACTKGLGSAKYDGTTFALDSALSTTRACPGKGKNLARISEMCLYLRTGRVSVESTVLDPSAKPRLADEKNERFSKAFGCDSMPKPGDLSWHQALMKATDSVRIRLRDIRWSLQHSIKTP